MHRSPQNIRRIHYSPCDFFFSKDAQTTFAHSYLCWREGSSFDFLSLKKLGEVSYFLEDPCEYLFMIFLLLQMTLMIYALGHQSLERKQMEHLYLLSPTVLVPLLAIDLVTRLIWNTTASAVAMPVKMSGNSSDFTVDSNGHTCVAFTGCNVNISTLL